MSNPTSNPVVEVGPGEIRVGDRIIGYGTAVEPAPYLVPQGWVVSFVDADGEDDYAVWSPSRRFHVRRPS